MSDSKKKQGYETGYAGHVDSDYLDKLSLDDFQIKERTHVMMRAGEGHRVLDVGCGPASDTIALARIVGPSGRVIGVDHDPDMIATANRRAMEAGLAAYVEHQQADGLELPFEDNSFDSCRSERVFQHVPEANQLLLEMIRVTKPGGFVVVADTDHSTHGTSSQLVDMDLRLRGLALQVLKNPHVGRKLYSMMKLAGLLDVEFDSIFRTWTDFDQWRPLAFDLARPIGLQIKVWTEQEVHRYEDDLQRLNAQGAFYAHVGYVLAAGRKPE